MRIEASGYKSKRREAEVVYFADKQCPGKHVGLSIWQTDRRGLHQPKARLNLTRFEALEIASALIHMASIGVDGGIDG